MKCTILRLIPAFFLVSLMMCTIEDSVGVKINYFNVVGQYDGKIHQCEFPKGSGDSICQTPIADKFKVILFDPNTIIISDEKQFFSSSKLNYLETNRMSNKNTHIFSSDSLKILLSFEELSRSIKVTHYDTLTEKKVVNLFNGIKI